MKDIIQWCEGNGVEPEIFGFDSQVSGHISWYNRPGLTYCLDQLNKGDVLVVRNLDRLSRAMFVGLAIEHEIFEEKNALLAAVENGGFQEYDPVQQFIRITQYFASQMHRKNISERSSRVANRKIFIDGVLITHGKPPFGYKIEDTKLIPNPVEQEIIKELIAGRNSKPKVTFEKIAKRLNHRGFTNRIGRPWATVRLINLYKALKARKRKIQKLGGVSIDDELLKDLNIDEKKKEDGNVRYKPSN
jgi:DNA invertase Pin-like site-specific DNA recombinase